MQNLIFKINFYYLFNEYRIIVLILAYLRKDGYIIQLISLSAHQFMNVSMVACKSMNSTELRVRACVCACEYLSK